RAGEPLVQPVWARSFGAHHSLRRGARGEGRRRRQGRLRRVLGAAPTDTGGLLLFGVLAAVGYQSQRRRARCYRARESDRSPRARAVATAMARAHGVRPRRGVWGARGRSLDAQGNSGALWRCDVVRRGRLLTVCDARRMVTTRRAAALADAVRV